MPKTELRAEVEIEASPAHVYRVLTDFASYPEWNPFITSISGALVVGQKLELELSLPEGKTYLLEPRLTAVREAGSADDAGGELRWRGAFVAPFLLEADHFFLLSALGPRLTRFVQGEIFSGLLLRFAGNSLTLTARGFVYMNQALKKRAEATFTE